MVFEEEGCEEAGALLFSQIWSLVCAASLSGEEAPAILRVDVVSLFF